MKQNVHCHQAPRCPQVKLGHHTACPGHGIVISTMGIDYYANKHIIAILVVGSALGKLSVSPF